MIYVPKHRVIISGRHVIIIVFELETELHACISNNAALRSEVVM